MDINIPNKITGDSHAASEFNVFKDAINSKADKDALQREIDDRLANELIFEQGFQSKVNKTDYAIDKEILTAADGNLQSQIDLLSGGSDIDLSKYLTITGATSTYQVKGNYLVESDITGKFLPTGTTLFDGQYSSLSGLPNLFNSDYSSLNNKPQLFSGVYGDLAGLPNLFDGAYSSLSGLPQLFSGSYLDLANKPTIPSVNGLASESYVDSKISALVDSAPEVLNTLSELANSLGNDPNFATTVSNQIGLKANSADVFTKTEINSKGFLTGVTYSQIVDKPLLFSGAYGDLSGLPNLFDGSYLSLSNKPVITDSYSKVESDNKYSTFSGSYTDLTNKPTLQNIVLTTTGTTGAATLNGNALNIPSYTGGSGTTLNGTGFVKVVGTTVSYDNSTYLTTTTASSTYYTSSAATTALAAKADLSLTLAAKTANYTLVLADNGKMIQMNMSGANTLTIPTNASVAFPIGTQIIVQAENTGITTITPASGVTINSVGSKTKITGQYSVATLIKKATNVWLLSGDISA